MDKEGLSQLVGKRLREVRKYKGLTLDAVQILSNGTMRATTIGSYERGSRELSVGALERVCAFYEIRPWMLLNPSFAIRHVVEYRENGS